MIFDTTRLSYSRWQVQCKNTAKVALDQVAKEYALKVMRELNLCIIFIEKDDIEEVLESPANIIDVLNRESMKAKKIKVLDMTETDM